METAIITIIIIVMWAIGMSLWQYYDNKKRKERIGELMKKTETEEEPVEEQEEEQETEEVEEESRCCSIVWSVFGTEGHNGKTITFGELTPTEAKDLFGKIKGAYDANLKMLEWNDVLVSIFPLDTLELQNSEEESFTFEVEYDSQSEEE